MYVWCVCVNGVYGVCGCVWCLWCVCVCVWVRLVCMVFLVCVCVREGVVSSGATARVTVDGARVVGVVLVVW